MRFKNVWILGSVILFSACVSRDYNRESAAELMAVPSEATVETVTCRYSETHPGMTPPAQNVEVKLSVIRDGVLKNELFISENQNSVSVTPAKLAGDVTPLSMRFATEPIRFQPDLGNAFVLSVGASDKSMVLRRLPDGKSSFVQDGVTGQPAECTSVTAKTTIPLFANFYKDFDRTQIADGRFLYSTPTGAIYMETGFPVWYDLYLQYKNEVNFNRLTPEQVEKQNLVALQELYAVEVTPVEKRLTTIDKAQGEKVLAALNTNAIAGPMGRAKYDPNGSRGFCFGRAAFVHLELIARGVNKNSIRKAFVVGPMKTGSTHWQFHVTTVVKGSNGEWLTIDPVTYRVLDLKDWFKQIMGYSVDKKLKLYITEANKFGPSAPKYNPIAFKDSFYNGYFVDLMKWFSKSRALENPESFLQ